MLLLEVIVVKVFLTMILIEKEKDFLKFFGR